MKKCLKIQKIIDKTNFKFEYIDLGGGMGINYEKIKKKNLIIKISNLINKFVKKNN